MKKDLCEIICVVDRSGSMGIVRMASIEAFNKFLEEQKAQPKEAVLTYVQFDDQYELIHNAKDIQKVEALSTATYIPRGGTALLDAVGKTIDDVGQRLHNTSEELRPERIIFVILTDGQENSSNTFNKQQIFEKIAHQRDKYSWQFLFLAAGQDAFDEAVSIGIKTNQSMMYAQANPVAHMAASKVMSDTVSSYRSGGSADLNP